MSIEENSTLGALARWQAEVHAVDISLSESNELAITEDAEAVKLRLQSTHELAAQNHMRLREKQAEIEEELKQQAKKLELMAREMGRTLAPLEEKVALLQDGIAAVNLYVGRDESIELLRDGAPAPEEEPLTIRQTVLSMDEECAVNPEGGGIDSDSIWAFTDWLLSDEKQLNKVIPEPKSVVALRPRRKAKHYSDNPYENAARNQGNFDTYWLIRNGEKIFLMSTDFNLGVNVIPPPDEFTKMFISRWDGKPLQPGSKEWLLAEKQANARTRHYMKVALVLQGLIDRTPVLHPLPHPALSLLSDQHYEQGFVKLVTDNENAVESGRLPFDKWIQTLKSQVNTGERIIGYFPRDEDSPWAERPSAGVPYLVTKASGNGASRTITFSFDRKEEIWDEELREYRLPKRRASYSTDGWFNKFIPIDRVTVDEMQAYLDSRTERHAYADMFPIILAGIAFKQAEEEAEAPFQLLLKQKLQEAHVELTGSEAAKVIADVTVWFKTANKWHRALNTGDVDEAKAARMILREANRRVEHAANDQPVVDRLIADHPKAMFIGRSATGFVVIYPEPTEYPNLTTKCWVRRIDLTPKGTPKTDLRNQQVSAAQRARWIPVYTSSQADAWDVLTPMKECISDSDVRELIRGALAMLRENGLTPLRVQVERAPTYLNVSKTPLKAKCHAVGVTPVWNTLQMLTRFPGKPYLNQIDLWLLRRENEEQAVKSRYNDWSVEQDLWVLGGDCPQPPWLSGGFSTVGHWEDTDAVAGERSKVAVWESGHQAARELEGRVTRYVQGLDNSYYRQQLALARERFIADYGPAEQLWEGHLKTIEIPKSVGIDRHDYNPIQWVLMNAVQRGVDLAGLTLQEASQKVGDLDTVITPERWMAPVTERKAEPIPEEYLQLTIEPVAD
ncbi:hypothetical protein [Lysinibacter cavernae]|uniref:hypothetical protein n=1 Tax=Lysinibacter cavernae TaxID=1640652 RepID=UPI0036232AC4